ncbi:MAG: aldolase/citrate lyase family protein [Bacillus subtilis]|nr:aldolase/citrate lyase family protein [Bacillus subtilis]
MAKFIIGPAYQLPDSPVILERTGSFVLTMETDRFKAAIFSCKSIFQSMAAVVEEDQKQFHDTILFYLTVLDDDEMLHAIIKRMERRQESAEEAVLQYFAEYRKKLANGNAYFQSRQADINDIQNQILNQLTLAKTDLSKPQDMPKKPFVLFVKELTISGFGWVEFDQLLAVVAEQGGYNSHAAIILNANQIPLLIIPETQRHFSNGEEVLIDFTTSTITFHPTLRLIQKYKTMYKNEINRKGPAFSSPIHLSDSRLINVYPAVNHVREAADSFVRNSEGIGLYRTEFLAFEKGDFLSEMEQYQTYLELTKIGDRKRVYFRLYDIEPDKTFPDMGFHSFGVRFLVDHPAITLIQMKAMLRISVKSPIGITIPMVETNRDIDQIRDLLRQAEDELRNENPDWVFDYHLGAMIETIAITHNIRKLASLDYLQVGSNDLLSRLLEVRRDSLEFSSELFHDPLFLRMMKRIVDDAKRIEVPLFLCGEAANQHNVVLMMLAIGVEKFCPSPFKIAEVYLSIDIKKIELLESMMPTLLAYESISQVQKKLRFI